MRISSVFATLLPIAVALAQQNPTTVPLTGKANILVSSRDEQTLAETPIGCLDIAGQVTVNTTACGVFAPSSKKSIFGGTAIDAGSGACGRIKGPQGPFACNATVLDKAVLGFFELDDKLAAQEFYTAWGIDAVPTAKATQTLYWQGLHALRAVLHWTAV